MGKHKHVVMVPCANYYEWVGGPWPSPWPLPIPTPGIMLWISRIMLICSRLPNYCCYTNFVAMSDHRRHILSMHVHACACRSTRDMTYFYGKVTGYSLFIMFNCACARTTLYGL